MRAGMDSTPFRVAVIGCGAIASEHLAFLASEPRIDLVGVCDASKAAAIFAQARFGAGQWFTGADEMFQATRPDVVHVLTPPQTHAALVKVALGAGAHVICEKPLTPSAAETEELLALARHYGRMLIESRNLLFNDPILEIDRLVKHDRLGSVREIDVLLALDLTAGPFGDPNLTGPGVALPGGAVHDFLPHLAYLFLHFAGQSEPSDVVGFLQNRSGNERVGFDHLDALIVAGTCRGRLRIASDVKPEMFRFILRGSKGSVETDFYNPFLRFQGGANVGKRAPLEQIISGLRLTKSGFRNLKDKVLQHGTYHGLPRMLAAVYQALQTGGEPPIRDSDIMASASLIDRLVQLQDPK